MTGDVRRGDFGQESKINTSSSHSLAKKIRKILESKRGKGYLVSAALDSITPFFSCSTIPMLSGLLKARADFGPVLTFLFASPLLNPIVIVLFFGVFGARVTATYAIVSLLFALLNGFLLDKLNFKRFVKQEIYHSAKNAECSANQCNSTTEDIQPLFNAKGLAKSIWAETYTLFKTVLPYLLIGAAIGAFIHGFVPSDIIASYAGPDNPFAIPVAAVIGIPLYVKASTMVPLVCITCKRNGAWRIDGNDHR